MATKTPAARVTDTINYINAWNGSMMMPGPVKTAIVAMINQQFPPGVQPAFDNMSGRLSVSAHGGWFTGGPEDRRARRAIALLYEAIGAKQGFGYAALNIHTDAMTMPTSSLAEAMEIAMVQAAGAASPAGIAWVFNHFFANPASFIRRFKIFIQGSTVGQALVNTAPVGPPGPGAFQNLVAYNFSFSGANDRFDISPFPVAPPVESCPFTAVSVPAIRWDAVPARGNALMPPALAPAGFDQMVGVEMAGSQYMVTTQFTGCSFCWATGAANPYAVHISPGATGIGGPGLANQLMGNSQPNVPGAIMSNYPGGGVVPEIFGSGAGNFAAMNGNGFYSTTGTYQWMSLFGRNFGAGWELYTQTVGVAGQIDTVESRRIR